MSNEREIPVLSSEELHVITPWNAGARDVERMLATIAAKDALLAECFRLSGADPDGNEDWRLAQQAVQEVDRLRHESDVDRVRINQLESQLNDALSMSTCTKCGRRAFPMTYPVIDESAPVKLVYRCPYNDCLCRVDPPQSAKIEALESKLRDAAVICWRTAVTHFNEHDPLHVCCENDPPEECELYQLIDAALQDAKEKS